LFPHDEAKWACACGGGPIRVLGRGCFRGLVSLGGWVVVPSPRVRLRLAPPGRDGGFVVAFRDAGRSGHTCIFKVASVSG